MRQSYRKLAHMNIKNKLKGVHTVCLTNSTISGESRSSVQNKHAELNDLFEW